MLSAKCAPVVEACIVLLQNLGAREVDHYGRDLLDHLTGTYRLLRQWRNPEETCVAGLLHSVYVTDRFGTASRLQPISRSSLKKVIGMRSEELVFLYSIVDRVSLLASSVLPPHQIIRRDSGESLTISAGTLSVLLEIGAANLVEQLPYLPAAAVGMIRQEVGALQGMQDYLSGSAGRALFSGLREFEARYRTANPAQP